MTLCSKETVSISTKKDESVEEVSSVVEEVRELTTQSTESDASVAERVSDDGEVLPTSAPSGEEVGEADLLQCLEESCNGAAIDGSDNEVWRINQLVGGKYDSATEVLKDSDGLEDFESGEENDSLPDNPYGGSSQPFEVFVDDNQKMGSWGNLVSAFPKEEELLMRRFESRNAIEDTDHSGFDDIVRQSELQLPLHSDDGLDTTFDGYAITRYFDTPDRIPLGPFDDSDTRGRKQITKITEEEGLLEYNEEEWKRVALQRSPRCQGPRSPEERVMLSAVRGLTWSPRQLSEVEMTVNQEKRRGVFSLPIESAPLEGRRKGNEGVDERTSLLRSSHLADELLADDVGPDATLLQYVWEMVTHFFQPTTIRGKQARLTLWEILEHFDFLNDFVFICRVGMTTFMTSTDTIESHSNGPIAMVCLTCIWITSGIAYAMRYFIIYHRIQGDDVMLFFPLVVFRKIRTVGESSPEVLYMFERVFWTYQLVMRVVEDIPQVVCSAIFLSTFGSDFYTYFMISYSCMLMVLTSWRMGVMYPIRGTLSLIFSRQPPVNSPIPAEAATTTKSFAGFMALVFVLWTIADATCLIYFARGLWIPTFCVLTSAAATLAVFFFIYWSYLLKQSPSERLEEFHRNFETLETPRGST